MAFQPRTIRRALLLGFISWLVPLAIAFGLFPLKRTNAALFTTLMYLVVLATAGNLMGLYFRMRAVAVNEATLVGVLWLAMNLLFDFPMFAFGPMKMTVVGYYSEIGLVYLTFPLFGLWRRGWHGQTKPKCNKADNFLRAADVVCRRPADCEGLS